MKHLRTLAPLFTVLLLAACSTLGLEKAGSFNDRLGYALSAHTAVLQETTAELNAGKITADDAKQIAAIADNARALMDSARTVYQAGQVDEANRKLSLVSAVLTELQTHLRR